MCWISMSASYFRSGRLPHMFLASYRPFLRILAHSLFPMLTRTLKKKYAKHLEQFGINLNGTGRGDLQVHDERLYSRVFFQGSLGFGEAYMDGWWDVRALDDFFFRVSLYYDRGSRKPVSSADTIASLRTFLANLQSISRSFRIGEQHYDIGDRLFSAMLDSYMNYSCAYWKNAHDLETAQQAKMKLICEKLMLEPGMKVLDIGCGWGGIAKYMAENYGVSVSGITVSENQARYAQSLCRNLPVQIELMDYRQLTGRFDRIYSVGMFEHVGYKNYRTYMRHARNLLHEDGLFVLHTIGSGITVKTTDAWIEKYIFPNSMLPSASQITHACDELFLIEDWQNFGSYYDKTLVAWFKNFDSHWSELKPHYNDRFYRMWKYYLMVCAGSFRARSNQLWQIVLSPHGVKGCYQSPR